MKMHKNKSSVARPRIGCKGSSLLAAAVLGVFPTAHVSATQLFWDANGNTSGAVGGTGTWTTANTWRTGSTVGALGNWLDNNDAFFPEAVGTVTISSPVTATSLNFINTGTTNYVFTGAATLTLSGATPSISLGQAASSNNMTENLNSPISAANEVTFFRITSNTGTTINLGASNTFSGGVRIADPLHVNMNASSALGTSTVTVAGNQSMVTSSSGAIGPVGNMTVSNPFVLNPSSVSNFLVGLCSGKTGLTMDYTGQISGASDVVISSTLLNASGVVLNATGDGITVFSAATNTYTGATIINNTIDAVFRLGSAGALPTGTALVFGRGGTNAASNNGILDLYANDISISSLSTNLAVGKTAGGITNSDPGATSVVRTVNITGSSTTTYASIIGTASNAQVVGGNLVGLRLTSSHTGSLSLTGVNTYSGPTTIDNGTLVLAHTADASNTINSIATINSGGTLATPAGTQATTGRTGGNVIVNSGATVSPGTNGGIGTLVAPSLTANSGSIFRFDLNTASDYDVLTLTGALTLDSGSHTINVFGNPAIGNYTLMNYGSRVWDSTNQFTLSTTPGGSFTYQLTQSDTSVILNIFGPPNRVWDLGGGGSPVTEGSGTWSNGSTDFANTASGTPVAATFLNSENFDVTFGNDIGGPGGIITLGGNVHTGGKLIFGPTGSPYQIGLAASTETLTTSANGIQTNSSGSIESPVILEASQTWNAATGTTLTVNSAVSESAASAITKAGAGTVLLSASNSFTGGVNVSAGTLTVSNGNAAGSGTITISNAATLSTSQSISVGNAVSIDSTGGTISAATGVTSTLSGVIAGNGPLTKGGAGTLVLAGSNTFSGGIAITSGVVEVSQDANLGTNNFSLGNFAILRPTASFTTAKNIATVGTGGVTARFDTPTGVAFTATGNITGAANLAKEGAGTLVLSGNNGSFTGNIQYPAGTGGGTIETTSSNALGTGHLLMLNNGTLRTTSDLTLTLVRGNAFTLTKEGSAKLTVNGNGGTNNLNAGAAIVVNAGNVQMDSQTGLGGFNDKDANQMAITMNAGTELLLNWTSAGDGRFSKNITLNDATITRMNGATGGSSTEFDTYPNSNTNLGGTLTITGNSLIRNQEVLSSGSQTRHLTFHMPILISSGATLTLSSANTGGDYHAARVWLRSVNHSNHPNDAITLDDNATVVMSGPGEKSFGDQNTQGKPIIGKGSTNEATLKLDTHTFLNDIKTGGANIARLIVAGSGNRGLRVEAPMNASYTAPGAPDPVLRTYDGTTGLFGLNTTSTQELGTPPSGYSVIGNAYTVMSPKRYNQLGDSFPIATLGGTLTIAATDSSPATGTIDNGPNAAAPIRIAVDNTPTSGNLLYQIDGSANSAKFSNFAGLSVKRTSTGAGSVTAKLISTTRLPALPTVAPSALFDVDNERLIVQFGTDPSPLAATRAAIILGRGGTDFANATWQGTGGFASDAAAPGGFGDGTNPGDGISFAVGYVENSFLPSLGLPSYTEFGGQTVDSGSMLIRFTRGADANLDGRVNTDDVTIVGALYGQTNAEWAYGDFDYDGVVDSDDVTVLGALYDATAPALSTAQLSAQYGSEFATAFARGQALGAAVPEPGSAMVYLGFGALAALKRRRRHSF